jgi:hypothetical protein
MQDAAEHIYKVVNGMRIEEVIDQPDWALVKRQLSVPDMRPQAFDVTIDGWMARIELWGKIKIRHEDPENRVKEDISQAKFLQRLTDTNLLKMFGTWKIEEFAINKVQIYRDYIGMDGKQYRESFVVEIELKDELKKAIKPKKFFGLF